MNLCELMHTLMYTHQFKYGAQSISAKAHVDVLGQQPWHQRHICYSDIASGTRM